jgi:hypothetical protein
VSASSLAFYLAQCNAGRFLKQLFGEDYDQMVLERLGRPALDEGQITASRVLDVVYDLVQNMRVVMDGEQTDSAGHPLALRNSQSFQCCECCDCWQKSLRLSDRWHIAARYPKLALTARSIDKSQNCLRIAPHGDYGVVRSRRHILGMEMVQNKFSFVDSWQTFVVASDFRDCGD